MFPANNSERCDSLGQDGGWRSDQLELWPQKLIRGLLIWKVCWSPGWERRSHPLVAGCPTWALSESKGEEHIELGSFIIQEWVCGINRVFMVWRLRCKARTPQQRSQTGALEIKFLLSHYPGSFQLVWTTCITAPHHAGERGRNSEINLSNLGHGSPEKLGLKITRDWRICPPAETNKQSAANCNIFTGLKLAIEQKHQALMVS